MYIYVYVCVVWIINLLNFICEFQLINIIFGFIYLNFWYLICNFIFIGLIIMDECILIVFGMYRKWQIGKCLLFNDVFFYGVIYFGSDDKGLRCVFIVDFWYLDIIM